MTDIVKRLRSENTLTGYYDPPQLQEEAADEIERLRAALRQIAAAEFTARDAATWTVTRDIARAALGEDTP